MFVCGSEAPEGAPDAGQGACCYGAAEDGPSGCVCWKPVYSLEQQELRLPVAGSTVRAEQCEDCAYRSDSPERQGDERYVGGGDDTLDELIYGDRPFWCHQGMRRPVAWVHPSGVRFEAEGEWYDPPIRDGVPFRADGTPGEICAGWQARHDRAMEEIERA